MTPKLLVAVTAGLLLAAAAGAQEPAARRRAVCGARGVTPEGELASAAAVVVFDGEKIAAVDGAAPPGATVDEYPGAVLCPGLVDCAGALGLSGALAERQQAGQPDLRGADALDRFSPQLRAALAAGVTTFALAPSDDNLVGGRVGVAQTAGPRGRAQLLTADGPLKLSLAPDVYKADREPTARTGAVGLLRAALTAANGAPSAGGPAFAQDANFRAFAKGELAGLVSAPTAADVLVLRSLAQEHPLKLRFIHTLDARELGDELADQLVVVGPLTLEAGARAARAASVLTRHKARVALAGGLPTQAPDTLRVGAAVAARGGLDAAAARRAISAVPAEVLGVAERVGALAPGRQADVVVFSGDPLDLRSRVLAVYVGGRRAWSAPRADEGEQP